MKQIEKIYLELGAQFVIPVNNISEKLKTIKAFVFDWDGVFNNGQKSSLVGSSFSEVDSMGTNLLRFSYFLKNNKPPLTAIISGEKNETAFYFSKRECFDYSFFKVGDKIAALNFLCEKENLHASEVAYFFDDVLDLPIAEKCGLRFLINQKVNPLFKNYCIDNNLVDYVSAASGGLFAVRETTELLIGLNENFDSVIKNRKDYNIDYSNYLKQRNTVSTCFYTVNSDKTIQQIDI